MPSMKYSLPDTMTEKNQTCCYHASSAYETSNKRDYKGLGGQPANNARPPTSQFYSDNKTGATGYREEFGWKTLNKEDAVNRPSSISAQRNNNPHPKETFMVWKFQNHDPNTDTKVTKEDLLNEICQDKIRSTYQVDYTGIQQGVKNKPRDPSKHLSEVKHEPKKTLNTTVRVDYQSPLFNDELNGNTTRYGCNSAKCECNSCKREPAIGAVPTVVRGIGTVYDTAYSKEYIKKENQMTKTSGEKDISDYLKNMTTNEKIVIADMLQSVDSNKTKQNTQDRISSWDGPSWK